MTEHEFYELPAHKQDEYTQTPDCPVEAKALWYFDDGEFYDEEQEMTDMFNCRDAADVLSAVVTQSCPFAAYCDGTHTVTAQRLHDGRIIVCVNKVVAGIFDADEKDVEKNACTRRRLDSGAICAPTKKCAKGAERKKV